jgi:hypothetical protein
MGCQATETRAVVFSCIDIGLAGSVPTIKDQHLLLELHSGSRSLEPRTWPLEVYVQLTYIFHYPIHHQACLALIPVQLHFIVKRRLCQGGSVLDY